MAHTLPLILAIMAAGVVAECKRPIPTKPMSVLETVMDQENVPQREIHGSFWRKSAAETIKSKVQIKLNENKAKNGIMFIGDGMSLATIMAARTYVGQLEKGVGEDNVLDFEKFPVSGLARTYCIDAQVADSACTATSYSTGVKTKFGVVGLDGNVTRGSCHSQLHKGNWAPSIGQWALERGLAVECKRTIPTKPMSVLETAMDQENVPEREIHGSFWRKSAAETIKSKVQVKMNENKAKNGIMFIGDGMSLATIMAARTYVGQLEKGVGEDNVLDFEKFPVSGLARTYCIDAQVADSACTATSYLTGVKTKFGVVGLDGNVTRGSCHSQLHKGNWAPSIGQWALERGLAVGLVTTTRVTHASPSGMYAHTSDRNWESDADIPKECLAAGCQDIATQLMTSNPGRHFKVVMGGGRHKLLPKTPTTGKNGGERLDGVDLIDLWHKDKAQKKATHQYVTDRDELMKVFNGEEMPEYLLGLFNDDHMDYHLQAKNQPTLAEMVEAAIKVLSRNPRGYFLFVEGGRIDHAHHDSQARLALDETAEYAKAVQKAHTLTNEEDTLIVVSADHSHTMTVAGYPSRGNDILGLIDSNIGMDSIPYTAISYANGKAVSIGPDGKRVDVSKQKDFVEKNPEYRYPSLVSLDHETHGGEDVVVFARGPWQHLFTSSYEQTVVPHLMAYAMCLGEDRHKNCRASSHHNGYWRNSGVSQKPGSILLILSISAVIVVLFRF